MIHDDETPEEAFERHAQSYREKAKETTDQYDQREYGAKADAFLAAARMLREQDDE